MKELVAQTKEAKGHALTTAVGKNIDDDTADRVLLYAESLAFAEVYLQIALVRKIRLERHDETRNRQGRATSTDSVDGGQR